MFFQTAMHALSFIDVTVATALATLALSFTLSLTGLVRIAAHTLTLRHEARHHSEDRHAC